MSVAIGPTKKSHRSTWESKSVTTRMIRLRKCLLNSKKGFALSIIDNYMEAEWVTAKEPSKNLSNETVKILRTPIAHVEFNSWSITIAHYVKVENGVRLDWTRSVRDIRNIHQTTPNWRQIVTCVNTLNPLNEELKKSFDQTAEM